MVLCGGTGITVLLLLPLTSAAVINESYSGYLFTVPDQPDIVTNIKTKNEAQQWCQGYDSALLEIYDSRLQQNVESFVNKTSGQQTFGNRNMFTNGMRTGTPWMWVNGNDYTSVGAGILNQPGRDYVYGYLLLNQTGLFFFADNMPANKRSYICKENNLSDWEFRYNDSYYVSISTTLSWYDARNECLNRKGDLASFDFVTDQQRLNSLNGSWLTANTPYWIGLRRQSWTWQQSKLEIKYTHWEDGHPQPTSGDCLCLLSKGARYEWTECSCDTSFQFICMKNIAETSLSTTSSTKATVSESGSTVSPVVGPSSSSSSSSSNNNSAMSSQSGGNAMRLGVGIGVGVGGGLLIIIVVIVVVVLLIKKRRHKGQGNSRSQRRLQTPDIIGQQQDSSAYAEIQRTSNDDTETNKANDKSNIVYSDLQIRDAV